jgi:hypothetical protein
VRYEHPKRQPLKVYIDKKLTKSKLKMGETIIFNNNNYRVTGAGYSKINPEITYVYLEDIENSEE